MNASISSKAQVATDKLRFSRSRMSETILDVSIAHLHYQNFPNFHDFMENAKGGAERPTASKQLSCQVCLP